jgi:predicted nucleotidyltransferase
LARYRKKPVVIEAMKFNGSNQDEIKRFTENGAINLRASMVIPTEEGDMEASIGDYIIKGVQGEFYPCKPDIFEQTYEKVD